MSEPLIALAYDGPLDIATGKYRKQLNWKNQVVKWSTLVRKLQKTHYTAETLAEYQAADKSRQAEIKDIGGFVGGYLTGGRRLKDSVLHRQLVTLDLDYNVPRSFWSDYCLFNDNAAAIYTTHSHQPTSGRLRLLIPLDRSVGTDEYAAICRRIAGDLNIELFDPTAFRPHQLMYWPSTPVDGEYLSGYQDGPWLSADKVLATYVNWRDASEWPESIRTKAEREKAVTAKRQADPLEKEGIVGAFCRAYTVSEAIEAFLADIYDPCEVPDRFTFRAGSTAAGLVIYDDKFTFSHHGTDPTSGELCNAFDLVRIHLFGAIDKGKPPGKGNPLSFSRMAEMAMKDARVRIAVGEDYIVRPGSTPEDDFAEELSGIDAKPEPADAPRERRKKRKKGIDIEGENAWMADMDVDKQGKFYSTINNIVLLLENDPALRGCFAYNKFDKREVALRELPWRPVAPGNANLTDMDDSCLQHYLEKQYKISGAVKILTAISVVMNKYSFHPVRDYLDSLVWDGGERLDHVLTDYLGAEDSDYSRAVTRKTLCAAVARIYRPGIKFDHVLTLVGREGLGKSFLVDKLGGPWYSDSFSTVQGKEAYEQIQGVWLVEMGELAGLNKAETNTIKHFISKKVDRYRVAFGRRTEDFPRQCVFFATTNNPKPLRDTDGNRKFWLVDIHAQPPTNDVFTDLNQTEVDQIWAEAVHYYLQGEKLYLPAALEAEARKMQDEHLETDDRTAVIVQYLNTLLPENWEEKTPYQRREWYLTDEDERESGTIKRTRVVISEIWFECLGGQLREMTKYNTRDLHGIMRTLRNWHEPKWKIRTKWYGVQRGYARAEELAKLSDRNL